jgi:hypothetical protein
MSQETKLELEIVEAYCRDRAEREREMLSWIAAAMEEAFNG